MNLNTQYELLSKIIPVVRYAVHRKTSAGWKIDSRTIQDHELVFIEKGSGVISIEGVDYRAEPDMLFYFNPGLEHSLKTDDGNPFCFYAVHFSYAFYKVEKGSWQLITKENLSTQYADLNIFKKLPFDSVQKVATQSLMLEFFRRTIDSFNKKLPDWELSSRISLESLIHQLSKLTSNSQVNYGAQVKIENVSKYILDNIYKKFELSDIAKQVNISPDYLSKIFKCYTGYPLMKYIHNCKIQHAKSLLLEGNLKIKEVAEVLGYCDEFHFSKVFKSIEGISPRNFIK